MSSSFSRNYPRQTKNQHNVPLCGYALCSGVAELYRCIAYHMHLLSFLIATEILRGVCQECRQSIPNSSIKSYTTPILHFVPIQSLTSIFPSAVGTLGFLFTRICFLPKLDNNFLGVHKHCSTFVCLSLALLDFGLNNITLGLHRNSSNQTPRYVPLFQIHN